ncbi:MAG: hypothetical protein KDB07_10440, partial [Planctomycetes bacterium]|nr:hypothetical protein [Planctomycetota bacterium]
WDFAFEHFFRPDYHSKKNAEEFEAFVIEKALGIKSRVDQEGCSDLAHQALYSSNDLVQKQAVRYLKGSKDNEVIDRLYHLLEWENRAAFDILETLSTCEIEGQAEGRDDITYYLASSATDRGRTGIRLKALDLLSKRRVSKVPEAIYLLHDCEDQAVAEVARRLFPRD